MINAVQTIGRQLLGIRSVAIVGHTVQRRLVPIGSRRIFGRYVRIEVRAIDGRAAHQSGIVVKRQQTRWRICCTASREGADSVCGLIERIRLQNVLVEIWHQEH